MAMQRQASNRGEPEDLGWRASGTWNALQAMRIGPQAAPLTFTARLARDNGWSLAYAETVVGEYKRFLYLASISPQPVTPSDEVDQAWHLHLAYSRHYWDVLCGNILGRPLHHGPTAGGARDAGRYRRQYEDTLARYRAVFGSEPPVAIWPDAATRFSARPLRIDRRRYWLVPKALAGRGTLAAGAALVAACSTVTVGSVGVVDVAAVIIAIMCLVVAGFIASEVGNRDRNAGGGIGCGVGGGCGGHGGGWGDGNGVGCGGGGCGGCGG